MSDQHPYNVKRILEENPALRESVESAVKKDEVDNLLWELEADRIRNVMKKLAMGHVAYELYPILEKPRMVGLASFQTPSDDQRSAFK